MLKISAFHKRRRKDKNTIEARASVFGKRISISAKTEEELRERIREYVAAFNKKHMRDVAAPLLETATVAPPATVAPIQFPKPVEETVYDVKFMDFATKYLETVKKQDVSAGWYIKLYNALARYVFPSIGDKRFSEISVFDLQILLNDVRDLGFERTSEDLHNLLNQIFDFAEVDGIIGRNPMRKIRFHRHERKKGRALTYQEEVDLLNVVHGTRYFTPVVLMLYCGLRAGECITARISDDGFFIVANNSKRKHGKKELKYIPITPMLRHHLPALDLPDKVNTDSLTSWLYENAPEGITAKMCRHTFNTRLVRFKINPEFRELAMGHKIATVNVDTYTHYEDVKDIYFQEFQRVDYLSDLLQLSPTYPPTKKRRDHHKNS